MRGKRRELGISSITAMYLDNGYDRSESGRWVEQSGSTDKGRTIIKAYAWHQDAPRGVTSPPFQGLISPDKVMSISRKA